MTLPVDLDALEHRVGSTFSSFRGLTDGEALALIAELRAARKVVEEARKVRMEQFEALNAAIAEYEAVVSGD